MIVVIRTILLCPETSHYAVPTALSLSHNIYFSVSSAKVLPFKTDKRNIK
jgi:hypothetical protein